MIVFPNQFKNDKIFIGCLISGQSDKNMMKRLRANPKVIILLLFNIAIFFFLLRNSFSYLDPDLGWHLKIGQEIIEQKTLPRTINNNFVLVGAGWVDHEWLMDLITYLLYFNYGYLALNIFFVLVVIITLNILLTIIKQFFPDKQNIFYVLFLLLLGVLGMAPHLGIRLQEITILNLGIVCYLLFHYAKNRNYLILFFLPPLFYFWASVHAGFLIGLFILVFWLMVKIVELLLVKAKDKLYFIDFSKIFTGKELAVILIFILASFLATMLTPYKFTIYEFLKSYGNTYYLRHIQEWLPFYYLPIEYKKLFYYALLVIAILLVSYLSIKKKVKEPISQEKKFYRIDLWLVSSSALFLFLSAKSNRNFPLLFIISFPLAVSFFSDYLYLSGDFIKQKLGKFINIVYVYLIAGLLLASLSNLAKTNFITDPFLNFCSSYPCQAVSFLKDHPEYNQLNWFNDFDYGGYLLWRLPESKLFIDGRFPQYFVNGQTILEEYNQFFDLDQAEEKLERYRIGLVLLRRDQPPKLNWFEKYALLVNLDYKPKYKNYLLEYLQSSPDWQGVYFDENNIIYAKKS